MQTAIFIGFSHEVTEARSHESRQGREPCALVLQPSRSYLLNSSAAFVPPKPNEFDSA